MGHHVLCVINESSDGPDLGQKFEAVMLGQNLTPVDDMNAFYRYFDDEATDAMLRLRAQAALDTAAEISGLTAPEAVLAIA